MMTAAPGAGVAVMLAQVERQAGPLDLHVERRLRGEAVLEGDPEPQEIDIELLRLFDREDAQDGDRALERNRHCGLRVGCRQ
jgi:hypothetical protein